MHEPNFSTPADNGELEQQNPISTPKPTGNRPICGAKTRAGGVCHAPPMSNGRCRVHGGASLSGPAAGSYKHGRRSRLLQVLPAHMRKAAAELANDPDKMAMVNHQAVLHSMLVESIEKWDVGAGDAWPEVRKLWTRYRSEMSRGKSANPQRLADLANEITDLVENGAADYRARVHTRSIIQDIRRVNETETKRLITSSLVMSYDEVGAMMTQVLNILMDEVRDPKTLSALHRRFSSLMKDHRESLVAQVQ